jgi:signal transduction histidine kinase
MARRSIGFPLTVGIVLTLIAVSLAVGWQILVVADLDPMTRGLTTVHWMLISLGALFFVLIILGLVLLCAWLVREMRVNQRQQAFLDAVTHEMKTPLASMRLYLDTLGRHDVAPERRKAFLGRMEEDVERLEHTVSQVLAAARAEGTVRRHRGGPVDLAAVLDESIEAIRARHGLAEDAIRVEQESPIAATGDHEELGVVFRNLLENAVKYSEPPVEVRVRLSYSGDDRVEVEIADQGIGIERRELRKIFQRFYRVGRDVQRHAAGLGLGLFIVGSLVRRQGGRVVARSEGSGRGSRFVVTLRAARAAPPRRALEAAPQLGSSP